MNVHKNARLTVMRRIDNVDNPSFLQPNAFVE